MIHPSSTRAASPPPFPSLSSGRPVFFCLVSRARQAPIGSGSRGSEPGPATHHTAQGRTEQRGVVSDQRGCTQNRFLALNVCFVRPAWARHIRVWVPGDEHTGPPPRRIANLWLRLRPEVWVCRPHRNINLRRGQMKQSHLAARALCGPECSSCLTLRCHSPRQHPPAALASLLEWWAKADIQTKGATHKH